MKKLYKEKEVSHRRKSTFFNHCLFVELISKADISSTVYLFVLIILQDIYLLFKKDHNPWILLRMLLGNAVCEEFKQPTSAVDEVPSVLILCIFCSNK